MEQFPNGAGYRPETEDVNVDAEGGFIEEDMEEEVEPLVDLIAEDDIHD